MKNECEQQDLIKTGVYTITNDITNAIYVGATTIGFGKRWNNHKTKLLNNEYSHHCLLLQEDVNKYGINNFTCRIERVITVHDEVWKQEREVWDKYKSEGRQMLNYRPCGKRKATMSEETRQKLLQTWARKRADGSSKACGWNRGLKMPEEQKRLISQHANPWHRGKKTGIVPKSAFKKGCIPWNKGKTGYMSKQGRENIAKAIKTRRKNNE